MSRVVIFGGVGFIGRNLVSYLASQGLVSKIAVVDKAIPQVSGLSQEELAVFESDKVIYKQGDASKPATVAAAFELDGGKWDYAINLAASTKYSQAKEVYQVNIEEVAKVTSAEAKKANVKRFINVSTAQVYDSGKKPSDETSKIKPWTSLAKASYAGEEAVRASGVPFIIVRPAIVYGIGDTSGITPRIIVGSVYQILNKKMKVLWSDELKINTVHISDVVAALWFLTSNGDNGQVFNLADTACSSQGTICELVSKLLGIKYVFLGDMKSKLAGGMGIKTNDVANEMHLQPWSQLLKDNNITDSPLTPYIDEELLYNNSTSVDGTKITTLGFKYKVPAPTLENLKEVVIDFEKRGFFPKGLLKV